MLVSERYLPMLRQMSSFEAVKPYACSKVATLPRVSEQHSMGREEPRRAKHRLRAARIG